MHDTSWALATKVRLPCGETESVAAVEDLRNQLRALAEKRLGDVVVVSGVLEVLSLSSRQEAVIALGFVR